jgi:hypothetical protein
MNRGDILQEAARLTARDRQRTPQQVAICMALVKIARLMETETEDSFVDLAAYAAIAGEIATSK